MDTANNCEAYMSRLLRKEKSSFSSSGFKANPRTKSSVNNKCTPKSKPVSRLQSSYQNAGKPQGCTNCKIDSTNPTKEVYMETAVTDLPQKISKPKTRTSASGDREPWGKILRAPNHETSSKFHGFDPLRTLHFLAKELQYKLQNDHPYDDNMQQIVKDMQNALTRVPPELASAIELQQSPKSDGIQLKKTSSSSSVLHGKKLDDEVRIPRANRSSQTIQKNEEAELIKKMMEGSTLKLEASCRQMETLCGRLKNEKDELENQLRNEKDSVMFLKKRVGDLEAQCDKLVTVTIKRLEEEKNELQLQVNKLTDIVDSQSVHTSYELKSVNQELKQVQMRAEQECTKLKHQLALSNMEKEKYIAILSVRDRQISEIRTEMSQLQDVVNEQLMDIHNNAMIDLPNMESFEPNNKAWMKDDASENNSNYTCESGESKVASNKISSTVFQDVPAESVSDERIFSARNSSTDVKNSMDKEQSNIREMFAELKKRAFQMASVTVVKP